VTAEPPALPNSSELAELLTHIATGQVSVAEAMQQLARFNVDVNHVTLDLDRLRRCGHPEVIYGAGKPAKMIAGIMQAQRDAGQDSLATRVDAETAAAVQAKLPAVRFNAIAKTLTHCIDRPDGPAALDEKTFHNDPVPPHVAVITAGSTDAPVAEEATETLHWMGVPFRSYDDIGVAGPARLLAAVPRLRKASAAIVIAGMEGALPAAVGGHLQVPVFAVPTSVGYGATLGGLTPLMGMLSACASNVAVVNIDAGFKAAYLAGLVTCPVAKSL